MCKEEKSRIIKLGLIYDDNGTVRFVDLDKKDVPLVRKALAYIHKQEQEERRKAREAASTCRNCQFSQLRGRYDGTLCCSKIIVNKYYKKVVGATETCELFTRKTEK